MEKQYRNVTFRMIQEDYDLFKKILHLQSKCVSLTIYNMIREYVDVNKHIIKK